jgi:aminopeptidase N
MDDISPLEIRGYGYFSIICRRMKQVLNLLITSFCLCLTYTAIAQFDAPKGLNGARTTIADTGELAYDIKYVQFNLNMTNASTAVSGDVTTTAVVTASSMSSYVFELNDTLTIDSVKINGILSPVSTTHPSVRKVSLSPAIPYGTTFTAQVFYHGTPPVGTGFFTHGLCHSTISSTGTEVTYTCGDPNWCSDWWPCKQVLGDKIDSVDMIVTVPTGTAVNSNGIRLSATNVAGGVQYHWKTKYAIDYYLIAVDVAQYAEYDSYIHYTGSTDSTLFTEFFYDTATFNPLYKKYFDSAMLMVDYFSQLYGRYPYDKEKFGYSFSTLNGGMENQTLVTIGVTQTPLIAHELGHQWFGDHVTYASWRDIWLSEGFACHNEQLFVEHFWGEAASVAYRTQQYNSVVSSPTGSVYVDDTTSVSRIFDRLLTYYKGAAVVHMLRYVAPNDSVFFSALKTYQNTYAFGLATTENLKAIIATAYGRNMDTFFNQWVYGQGYPNYHVQWNQSSNQVFVQIMQSPSDSLITPFFYTPIEVQLISATGDTTIKIYNDQKVQFISLPWDRTMTGLKVDPNSNVLHKATPLSITHNPALGINNAVTQRLQVYPNPATDGWIVTGIAAGTHMLLSDILGRKLWERYALTNEMMIPAAGLAAGNYILQLTGNTNTNLRLVRR